MVRIALQHLASRVPNGFFNRVGQRLGLILHSVDADQAGPPRRVALDVDLNRSLLSLLDKQAKVAICDKGAQKYAGKQIPFGGRDFPLIDALGGKTGIPRNFASALQRVVRVHVGANHESCHGSIDMTFRKSRRCRATAALTIVSAPR